MPKQPAIPGLHDAMMKVTRRGQILAEMETLVPWGRPIGSVAAHYPNAGPKGGHPPMAPEAMPRAPSLQNRHAPSNPMAGEPLCDSEAMRRFAGIGPEDDRIPDETAILNLRPLPERHGLTDRGITLRPGTLVDATRIDAPSSSRNKARARDPGCRPPGRATTGISA